MLFMTNQGTLKITIYLIWPISDCPPGCVNFPNELDSGMKHFIIRNGHYKTSGPFPKHLA